MSYTNHPAGGGRPSGKFKGGMTVDQARAVCAQVHNWALLATAIEDDPRRVPMAPDIPLKRLVYALDVLTKAGARAGISESTIGALVVARSMRTGVNVRTRRATGEVVTLTLNGGGR